jgi:hypothetical protein
MKRLSLVAAALLVAALALPLAASAEDAPGVFKVPGTDSTIKFYGYVQLDATVDFGGRPTDIENWDWATILPGVPADDSSAGKRNPQTYLTARTSRFGIQTNTPSAYGNVGVKLEGDFNGPNGFQSETYTNSVVFRLRHAYGTFGGLLVGQTWTTFIDLGAAPDTVDFNGPGTLALVRNPMIRYTFGLAEGMSLALALENNRGLQYGNDDTSNAPVRFQSIPDVHANFTYNAKWGHLSLRGVAQNYTRQINPATPDPTNKSELSVAGALSGSVKFGGDTLVAQVAGGPGIGRYFFNAANTPFVTVDGNDELQLWTAYGYHLGFTHVWSPAMRSSLVWSQSFIEDAKIDGAAAGNGQQKEFMQAFVNTFFTLTKTVEFGVEYEYGQWKSFSTAASPELKGTQNRITGTFHYNFF